MPTLANGRHAWRFYRAGGVDQVLLADAADVLALDQLDQKLWVALACPVKGLEFDERTLALLDTDGDGRVRAPEILGAVAWLRTVLREPQGLVLGADGVPLSALDTSNPEGQAVHAAARQMLAGIGKPDAALVTVADAMQTTDLLAKARLNGDGVVPPESLEDPALRAAAEDLLRVVPGAPDRGGKPGFDAARVTSFFALLDAYAGWYAAGEARAAEVLPLGKATAAAAAAVDAVAAKVEDWFLRVRLAAFDPRAQSAVNRSEEAYLSATSQDLTVSAKQLREMPLAFVAPDGALPLAERVNPAWQAEVDALRTAAVEPLLGRGVASLSESGWRTLQARLAAFRAWTATKAGAEVEVLGLERVHALRAPHVREGLARAVADDLTVAPQVEAMTKVERLARCWRDLFRLLNNFVSFTDFYARKKAVFQAGTLHLDARTTDLCVLVLDGERHALLAGKSGTYLAYVTCTRVGSPSMTVACAMTAGDGDNLFVGRNGLFYDRKGRDWDATVAKVIENPISVGQAFWMPYKRLIRWIEDLVAKRAAAADADANKRLQDGTTASAAASAVVTVQPARPKIDVGVVAALGVAVGGITAALGAMLQAFFGLGKWMPLGLLGLVLLISGPAMVMAWLKLRRRNLGPILDANGWAVNALTRINIPLGRSLTDLAALPPGASRRLTDPFAPRRRAWRWLLPLVVMVVGVGLITWKVGALSRWLPWVPAPEDPWFSSDCEPPTPPADKPAAPPQPPQPPAPVEGR